MLLADAEDVPDPVERVVATAAVPRGVLLDAAADVIDDRGGERDDVEGVEHGDGVLQLVVDGVLVAVERVQGAIFIPARKSSPRSIGQVREACPDRPGRGAAGGGAGHLMRTSSGMALSRRPGRHY
ncbi:MAG: hypothetical protein H7Y15_03030 [Pseudonocardia sp.]|nr:hypothetical protein [Pseudonocardia sp.]